MGGRKQYKNRLRNRLVQVSLSTFMSLTYDFGFPQRKRRKKEFLEGPHTFPDLHELPEKSVYGMGLTLDLVKIRFRVYGLTGSYPLFL